MDIKANLGSFGAALRSKDLYVMNVVPEDGPNTLKLIYDRGLIGSIHNWYVFLYSLCSIFYNIFVCLMGNNCDPVRLQKLKVEFSQNLQPELKAFW